MGEVGCGSAQYSHDLALVRKGEEGREFIPAAVRVGKRKGKCEHCYMDQNIPQ